MALLRVFSLSFAANYNLIWRRMKTSKGTSKQKRPKSKAKKIKRKVRLDTEIQMDGAEGSEQRGPSFRSLMLRKGEAVQLLNGNKMPQKFRFRERELQRIQRFLEECIKDEKKGTRFMMLTGSPGAGKSLCANTLLSKHKIRVIKMNANIVKSLQEVQFTIGSKLLGPKGEVPCTAVKIISMLEQDQFKEVCVVYIQEVELLFRYDPNPLTEDFMRLFQKKGLRLILIGISNTIDTLLKSSAKFCFKMHDVQNVIFSPYTAQHIAQIMKDKLAEVHFKTELQITFSDRLVKYSAIKLQTLKKGDFRVCLQFLKGVVQRVLQRGHNEGEAKSELQPQTRDRSMGQTYLVEIQDVNFVLSKMNVSKNTVIDGLPYQQKVMLIAIYTYFTKTDALCVTQAELQPEVRWICDSLQIGYTKQLMSDGLCELQQYSLIELREKPDGQKIMLKVSLDDIKHSFHEHFVFKKFFKN